MSVRKSCQTCKHNKQGICHFGHIVGERPCKDDMEYWELSDRYKAEILRDAETVPVVTEQAESVHDATRPSHYHKGGLECFDVINAITGDKYEGFLVGNIIKYIFRYRDKNGLEDCKKAAVYLNKLIKELENEK